eukprot:TRINITY_DN14795_c0_g1_i2.p1 TRINITY_DN14795_c0_g1~~TRINITY_DN14795_c0_g1_i2.p1  ORF type:complete len:436 (+),score=71.99 TRINITY_DN14795_c0_g1_i2:272-1579(+)
MERTMRSVSPRAAWVDSTSTSRCTHAATMMPELEWMRSSRSSRSPRCESHGGDFDGDTMSARLSWGRPSRLPGLPVEARGSRRQSTARRMSTGDSFCGDLSQPLSGGNSLMSTAVGTAQHSAEFPSSCFMSTETERQTSGEEPWKGSEPPKITKRHTSSELMMDRPRESRINLNLRRPRKTVTSFDAWMNATVSREKSAKIIQRKSVEQQAVDEVHVIEPLGCKKIDVVTDLATVRKLFDLYDTDQSGSIEPPEFPGLLARCTNTPRTQLNMQEVWAQWDEIDEDGNQTITFDEFRGWYCRRFGMRNAMDDELLFIGNEDVPHGEDEMRQVAAQLGLHTMDVEKVWREFRRLDKDRNGLLDKEEFSALIKTSIREGQAEVPKQIIDAFWRDCDPRNVGHITFAVFAKWYFQFHDSRANPMEKYYKAQSSSYLGGP